MEAGERLGAQREDEVLEFEHRVSEPEAAAIGPEAPESTPQAEPGLPRRSPLLDRLGALVTIFDRQGRIRWMNRLCEQTTGLSFEDVWGRRVWEVLVRPEQASVVRAALDDLGTGRFTRGYESQLVTQEGKPRVIQWSTAPLLNGDGPVEHIISVGVDVTERKVEEERLRKSEEHYRYLVESSPDAILVHHRGKIVFANRAGAALLGASDPGEIMGRSVLDFVHRDDRATVQARLRKVLEHDTELALIERRLVRLDGSVVRVEAHSIFPFMYQGKPAVQVVARSVTEATPEEPQLPDHHRQMWNTLLQVSSEGIITTDLRGRIKEASRRAAEMLGFSHSDQLVGKSAFELILPEDHEEFISNLQKTFKEGGAVDRIELSLVRQDGGRFRPRLGMSLLRDAQGKPQGFVITATDRDLHRSQAQVRDEPRGEGSESSALLEASRAVLVHRDFEPAARGIFDACRNLIGAGAGYVGLMNEDGTRDNVLLAYPDRLSWKGILTSSRPLRELRAEVYLTASAMYLNGLPSANDGWIGAEESTMIENVLSAPLRVGDNAVGVLTLANKPGGFTEEDARMASAFGELAAISLESSRALEALELSEGRFRSVAEATGDAIVTFDNEEHIVYWNPGAEGIFGHDAAEMLGKRLTLVAPADLREAIKNAVNEVESGGASSSLAQPVEMIGRRKDGSTFPLELFFAGWNTRRGVFLTSIIRDITERKLAEHDLKLLADHDHLTGLPNRSLFRDHLTQALAVANRDPQKLAVMMIDVDRFKSINHGFGSQAGDQLLQALGDRLTGLVRTADTVARSGDDEFVLLLLGIEAPGHTDRVAERIIKALREPFFLSGREVRVTVSMGIAVYPEDGDDVDTLLKRADLAMCRAKEEGRDGYQRFSPLKMAGRESEPRVT
jgi:diguanylate cyclase (GGDEF)-like protein/PAS domain S-box-containing protein